MTSGFTSDIYAKLAGAQRNRAGPPHLRRCGRALLAFRLLLFPEVVFKEMTMRFLSAALIRRLMRDHFLRRRDMPQLVPP